VALHLLKKNDSKDDGYASSDADSQSLQYLKKHHTSESEQNSNDEVESELFSDTFSVDTFQPK
jgi:hypothetical protein